MRIGGRPFLAVVVLATQGCVTGHLLDAARRIERPVAYEEASLDRDRLVVRYTAAVTGDDGQPIGRADRRAAIALVDLRRTDVPVERFPVRHLPDRGPLPGRSLPVSARDGTRPVLAVEDAADGRPYRLVVEGAGVDPPGAFYSAALTERRSALWVYPLLPFSLVFDAVTNPVLLFFAPAVIVVGD